MQETDTSGVYRALREGAPNARLIVEEIGRAPRAVALPAGAEVRVGRAAHVEVPLEDKRASRVHATFRFDGRAVTVRDEGSSNGTFIDGARVQGSVRVEPGSVVEVGDTKVAVVVSHRGGPRTEVRGPAPDPSGDVVAIDPAAVSMFALVRRLAASDLAVLIQGETGSGKEVVARALHRHSPRAGKEFIAVNCAALAETLAESELFGHEKGAFTGADARKVGVFEAADGGTLMLDEVGELSPSNQARLLRVLQERAVTRVGSVRPVAVSVRVVAATNRDLVRDVAQGRFREDLYFRLNGVTVAVPPLRSRPRDIVPIAEKILAGYGGSWRFGRGVTAVLQSYRWPGNVRELRNAIECAVALCDGDELGVEHLPPRVRGEVERAEPRGDSQLRSQVDELERRSIVAALEATGWNQSRAARELGISRRGLIYKMERFGLKPRPAGSSD